MRTSIDIKYSSNPINVIYTIIKEKNASFY